MGAGLLLCVRCVKENGRGGPKPGPGGTNLGVRRAMAKLIVRRGMGSEYYEFLGLTAAANGDELIVDRRRVAYDMARNGPGEPEVADRRGPASEKWIDEDVIVVKDKSPSD
jgi:hypothetical protein